MSYVYAQNVSVIIANRCSSSRPVVIANPAAAQQEKALLRAAMCKELASQTLFPHLTHQPQPIRLGNITTPVMFIFIKKLYCNVCALKMHIITCLLHYVFLSCVNVFIIYCMY